MGRLGESLRRSQDFVRRLTGRMNPQASTGFMELWHRHQGPEGGRMRRRSRTTTCRGARAEKRRQDKAALDEIFPEDGQGGSEYIPRKARRKQVSS